MPKETHTPLRNVRVPDEVWRAALAGTTAEGTSISAEVNAFLHERYVEANANAARKAARAVLKGWAHYMDTDDYEPLRQALGDLADAHWLDPTDGKPLSRTVA